MLLWSRRGIFTEHWSNISTITTTPQFFSECPRVLRPHGVIRVIVSDGEKYLKALLFRWLGADELQSAPLCI